MSLPKFFVLQHQLGPMSWRTGANATSPAPRPPGPPPVFVFTARISWGPWGAGCRSPVRASPSQPSSGSSWCLKCSQGQAPDPLGATGLPWRYWKEKKSYNLHLSSAPICITCEFVSFFFFCFSESRVDHVKNTITPHCLGTGFKSITAFATPSRHFFIYEIYLDSHTWGRPKPHSASGGAAWLASKVSSEWRPAVGLLGPTLMDFPPPSKEGGLPCVFSVAIISLTPPPDTKGPSLGPE